MKIVYFYQYFSTPKGSWGTRVYEFASEWVRQGHDVTVVTSIYSKSDLKAKRFIEDQNVDGIKLKVLNIQIDNKQPIPKRVLTFITYALFSSWYALTLPADVIIASSGPITVGIPGLVARLIRRRKLVFEVRDLWPQGAIELGIIKNPLLKKVCYWFEKRCYRASSLIVTLSPGAKRHIEVEYRHSNVISVTNAVNIELFSTKVRFDGRNVLRPKKYAIYTGNIGSVNNVHWLLGAAEHLKNKNREDIKVLLVGEGQQREELEALAAEGGIDNFLLWDLVPKEELVPLVQGALVSLVPLNRTPILDTSSPNKLFESLAAGVPVIQNTKGWMRDLLADNVIGYTLDPDDPEALADLLIELDGDPVRVGMLGENAARTAIAQFDKKKLAQDLLKAMEAIAG